MEVKHEDFVANPPAPAVPKEPKFKIGDKVKTKAGIVAVVVNVDAGHVCVDESKALGQDEGKGLRVWLREDDVTSVK